jgi:hypothetical protein
MQCLSYRRDTDLREVKSSSEACIQEQESDETVTT